MEPCVIIPTFWARRRTRGGDRRPSRFDHPTPVDQTGTLPACLSSLEAIDGLGRVVVIIAAADASTMHEAEDRVSEIVADFPSIDPLVVGSAEMGSLHRRLEQLEFADVSGGVGVSGYGAVRNAGLVISAILGHDTVVFIDDDEAVTDPRFLTTAMEGIGETTQGGKRILAKSGYYVDAQGRYQAAVDAPWYDLFWRQDIAYNEALGVVAAPPRIRPSSIAMGGCLALHRDMYCNVSFDPWVLRGEDMDYVINARMHGGDVFLDGEWSILHTPPSTASEATVFTHDVYRFIYEHRKLEFAESQVDLRQVKPEALMPYPGRFVDSSIGWRSRVTALLRALAGRESKQYLHVARKVVSEASQYARDNCEKYFAFQRRWPLVMDRIWEDVALKSLFTGERQLDRSAITGRFPVVRPDR